jgi:hypothetical protein
MSRTRDIALPERFVDYMIRCFSELPLLVVKHSATQVAQGLTQLFDTMSLDCCRWLFVPEVSVEVRVEYIRSMYDVFAAVVAKWPKLEVPDCFQIWWHDVGRAYWDAVTPVINYSELGDEARRLCDTIFEILVKILQLAERVFHSCALHGLGHLHHPGVRQVIQDYIDANLGELSSGGLLWLEQCRGGTNM